MIFPLGVPTGADAGGEAAAIGEATSVVAAGGGVCTAADRELVGASLRGCTAAAGAAGLDVTLGIVLFATRAGALGVAPVVPAAGAGVVTAAVLAALPVVPVAPEVGAEGAAPVLAALLCVPEVPDACPEVVSPVVPAPIVPLLFRLGELGVLAGGTSVARVAGCGTSGDSASADDVPAEGKSAVGVSSASGAGSAVTVAGSSDLANNPPGICKSLKNHHANPTAPTTITKARPGTNSLRGSVERDPWVVGIRVRSGLATACELAAYIS
jgi:hypothetical protein